MKDPLAATHSAASGRVNGPGPGHPASISNEAFLRAAAGPDWHRVKVAMFAGDPANPPAGSWQGFPAQDMLRTPHDDLNTYYSVGVQTGLLRGLAGFEKIFSITVDDVGTKVDLKQAIDLVGTNPSYILETSPGNCQAGWFCDIDSRDWALGLTEALYTRLGSDNIKNLVTYVRLPVGTNHKPKCGPGGFRHRLTSWNPAVRLGKDDWVGVEQRLGTAITPIRRTLSSGRTGLAMMPDPLEIEADPFLKAFRLLGRVQGLGRGMTMGWGFDVDCPWIEEHGERPEQGASYVPVAGRFHCHHGHCQDRGMGEVRVKLSEMLRDQHGTSLAALEFEDAEPAAAAETGVGSDQEQKPLASYEQTEAGLTEAFKDRHRDLLRFDHARGRWFEWTGGFWRQDRVQHGFYWALNLLRNYRMTAQDAGAGWLRSTGKYQFASAVERMARAHPELATDGLGWDQDPWRVGAPGCEINLKTGQVEPPDPSQRITKPLRVAPSDMPTPIWDQFLWDSTGGDPDMIEFLEAWAGYCLTGDISEEKFVFIYGPGGNGKGTFLFTISAILNDYTARAPADMFMRRKYEAHPEEIARLAGIRLVTATEIEEGRTFNITRLKDFTGRDGKLTGRFMRQNSFEYTAQFKPIFVGNNQPRLTEVDAAMRRRLILVLFAQTPKTADTTLKDRLADEYPGILRRMIEGERRRRSMGGLSELIPSAAVDATNRYLEGQDTLKAWAAECCTFGAGRQTGSSEAFESYRMWCHAQGEHTELNNRTFSQKFLDRFSGCKKQHVETGTALKGVGLKPQLV